MNRRDVVLAGLALGAIGRDIAAQNAGTDQKTGPTGTQVDLSHIKQNRVTLTLSESQGLADSSKNDSTLIGEKPFARDEEAWRGILESVATLYSLPPSLKGEFASMFLNIAHGLSFFRAKCDNSSFRYWHVEPLLEQAADLLDRAVRDRAEWDDKAIRSFALALELSEFRQLDKVHEDEIKSGFYTLPYKQSQADLAAEGAIKAGHSNTSAYLKGLLDQYYSWQETSRQNGLAQLSAWLSGQATYSEDIHGGALQYTWADDNGRTTQDKPKFLQDCAMGQADHALGVDRSNFQAHYQTEQGMVHASDSRQQGIAAKVARDKADVEFRRRRTEIARSLADLKLKAATDPNGVLNYPTKMLAIRERFERDVQDAADRLCAAQRGMKLLYGYEPELPTLPDSASFDEILLWTRNAISWINAFSQLEQNYVLSFSLRDFIPKSVWEHGAKQGKWDFALKPELFASQSHVRLRGVSACVEACGPHHVPYHLVLEAPIASSCRHISGAWVELDQSDVPPCRIGRAFRRSHMQEPDVVGISSLHNISPIGTWKMSFVELGSKKRKLQDVVVDLHLAFRSEARV
jgi:hypothetical protein